MLCEILSAKTVRLHGLGIYANVQARQREALLSLVRPGSKIPLSMRGAILQSWATACNRPDAEAALEKSRNLAGSQLKLPSFTSRKDRGVLAAKLNAAFSKPRLSSPADALPETTSSSLMEQLTAAQKVAVENSKTRCISLVRGPPGTGKTHVAAAMAATICSCLPEGARVLAVTQSHAAALNLYRRLEVFGVVAARVGSTLRPVEIMEQKLFQEIRR